MLVGLKDSWYCSFGYFFTGNCDADIQNFCLSAEHGLRIWSVTSGGTSINFNTFKDLGCIFSHDFNKIVTNFNNPSRDYQVYATLDVCFMLKLTQNALFFVRFSHVFRG